MLHGLGIGSPTHRMDHARRAKALNGKDLFTITHRTDPVRVCIQGNEDIMTFFLCDTPFQPIVLGYPWLFQQNPVIDWKTGVI